MSNFEKDAIRGVHTVYGPRKDEGATGHLNSGEDGVKKLLVTITAESLAHGYVAPTYLPAGAYPVRAYAETEEAFTLTGTTPTILVGTKGSESTNGVVVSEAQAEAVGSADISGTLAGTWAARLASATEVGVALGGGTPAVTGEDGKVKVWVEYLDF
jgi:hypothetical protein